ncbi:MAG: hypothetical protein IJS94_08115 [Clostridia bacterium]|nr:hypothetical protein [Clostridia bacterium]
MAINNVEDIKKEEDTAIKARDYETEISAEEAMKMFVECEKQQFLEMKYKSPSFSCPACGARGVLYADTAVLRCRELNEKIDRDGYVDYVVRCPKCMSYIAIRRQRGLEKSNSTFYSPERYIFMFQTVFNNRIRGIYHCVPPAEECIFDGKYERSYTPTKGKMPTCMRPQTEYESTGRETRRNTIYYELIIPKKSDVFSIRLRAYTAKVL